MDKKDKEANLAELAHKLAEGLQQEREAISGIKTQVEVQLEALRNQDRVQVEDATLVTSQEVNTLQKLRNNRDTIVDEMVELLNLKHGKARLKPLVIALATELKDRPLKSRLSSLVAELPEEAASAKESCKELAYSLQYALHLGQSIIQAVHGAASPPPVKIYTAKGNKELSSNRRMMVNEVG